MTETDSKEVKCQKSVSDGDSVEFIRDLEGAGGPLHTKYKFWAAVGFDTAGKRHQNNFGAGARISIAAARNNYEINLVKNEFLQASNISQSPLIVGPSCSVLQAKNDKYVALL